MLSGIGIRRHISRQLSNLGRYAAEVLVDHGPPPSVEPLEPLDPATEVPLDHLRKAIAAAQSRDGTAPRPKIYSELRLLLNQLESGRVSSEPSQTLRKIDPPLALPRPRPRLRSLLKRKAQAAARFVSRR